MTPAAKVTPVTPPAKVVPATPPAKAKPANAVPAARYRDLLARRHPVFKDTYWFPENGFVVDIVSKSVVGKCVDDKVLPLTEEDEAECQRLGVKVGIFTEPPAEAPPAKAMPLHVEALGLSATVAPAAVEVLPPHVAALGLVPDPVDELKMDVLSFTDNAKPFGVCSWCKKKFKIEGKWYKKHIADCEITPGFVDDTFSENEGDNELS